MNYKKIEEDRQKYNKEIIDIIVETLEKYPSLRFGQMLIDLNIVPYNRELFCEESLITFNRVDC